MFGKSAADYPWIGTRVFLASPLFELDERDLRLRRWRLWESVQGHGRPIPSVQLLAVVLLRNTGEPQAISRDLENKLARLAPGQPQADILIADRIQLDNRPDDIVQRLIYSIPWTLNPGEAYPQIERDSGEIVTLFRKRSVLSITGASAARPKKSFAEDCTAAPRERAETLPDAGWLEGRVVMIGASFRDGRDIYATPLGWMPGAMVLVNAIHSLDAVGPIKRTSKLILFLIELALIVVMSFVFARFDSFWATLIGSTAIIVVMLPISFWLFKEGVWLDFAIPLIGVQLHQMHASFEENRARAHRGHDDPPRTE